VVNNNKHIYNAPVASITDPKARLGIVVASVIARIKLPYIEPS